MQVCIFKLPSPSPHALSLGERENLLPSWVEIYARDIFRRGVSTSRFGRECENLPPLEVGTGARENSQRGKSDLLTVRASQGEGIEVRQRYPGRHLFFARKANENTIPKNFVSPSPLFLVNI